MDGNIIKVKLKKYLVLIGCLLALTFFVIYTYRSFLEYRELSRKPYITTSDDIEWKVRYVKHCMDGIGEGVVDFDKNFERRSAYSPVIVHASRAMPEKVYYKMIQCEAEWLEKFENKKLGIIEEKKLFCDLETNPYSIDCFIEHYGIEPWTEEDSEEFHEYLKQQKLEEKGRKRTTGSKRNIKLDL